MRISNESGQSRGGPFEEMVRLQTEFQARLADETMRYLRRVQASVGPVVPTTVVQPDPDTSLRAAGGPGDTVRLTLEVENRQEAHALVTPALTPLVAPSGAVWFPDAQPATVLLGPADTGEIAVTLRLPPDLPAAEFTGALVLHGFSDRGVPVTVEVGEQPRAAGAAGEGGEGGSPT